MNTSGEAFKSCSPALQQMIKAWSEQLNTILDEAQLENVDAQWLLGELSERKRVAFRKVQPWNAFLHEEAKGLQWNKEMLESLSKKYHETGEEDKKGYMKRMAHPVDESDVKKMVKKTFRNINSSMEMLLDFGIESVFAGASTNQGNHLPGGFEVIGLGDRARQFSLNNRIGKQLLVFLRDSINTNANTNTNASTITNANTNTPNPTSTNINININTTTEKVQKALGAAFGIESRQLRWKKVLMGPVYPEDTDDCVILEKWPLDVPTRKRMVDLTVVDYQKILDGDVLFKRAKTSQ
ncbi:hypothetical protein [Absidia glauca]|uniref:Uncharacterized protein n=1 Tax=Absidia glauca TaxID=4829 RepID=A0A168MXE8_ABSGL|nr:hypothetical protein [Absidia glauca]